MGNLEKLGILVIVILVVVVGVVAITPKATVDERLMPEMAAGEPAQEPEMLEPVTPPAPGDAAKPADPWPANDGKQTELKPLNGGAVATDTSAKPAPAPVPAAPSFRMVKVRPGDTLALIAKRELGAASRYPEILDANPGLVATRLPLGKEIKIPLAPMTAQAPVPPADPTKAVVGPVPAPGQNEPVPAPAAERTYVVKKGDTLSSIASREMGSVNKWHELLAANDDVLHGSTALKVGSKLRIPASEKSTSALSDLAPLQAGAASTAAGEHDYVVKSGDSLWLIAKNEMGSEKYVGALRDANAGVLNGSDNLKVGTKLKVPAAK
jgi:nucleoid-associated protein YgaU